MTDDGMTSLLGSAVKPLDAVEIVQEIPGTTSKLVLRVKNAKKWGAFVLALLLAADDAGDACGISVRKEYYIAEGRVPAFSWVLLAWGDLDAACEIIKSCVELHAIVVSAPTPPESPDAPVVHRSLIRAHVVPNQDGTKTEFRTLPFKHVRDPDRNRPGRKRRNGEPVKAHVEMGIVRSVDFQTGSLSKEP